MLHTNDLTAAAGAARQRTASGVRRDAPGPGRRGFGGNGKHSSPRGVRAGGSGIDLRGRAAVAEGDR